MEQKRQTVLLVILCLASVGANIFFNHKTEADLTDHPAANMYAFKDVFAGGVLMYRPKGTDGLALFDLSDAIIIVTERGTPRSCATIEIFSKSGNITTACASGVLSE